MTLSVVRKSTVDGVCPLEGTLQHRFQLVDRHLGDEAKAAQIDAENRHLGPLHQPRDAEQRAVAAQDDDQVGPLGHLFFAARARAVPEEARFDEDPPLSFLEPRHQPTHHLGGFRLFVFSDQSDDANHWKNPRLDIITALKIKSMRNALTHTPSLPRERDGEAKTKPSSRQSTGAKGRAGAAEGA